VLKTRVAALLSTSLRRDLSHECNALDGASYWAGAGRPCCHATRILTPRRSVRRGTTTSAPLEHPHHKGGYAESTVSPRRFPIWGYLASSLRRLRLARDGEQFGNAVGYCALRDQYRSLCAIRMSRTSGLARTFFDFPPKKLQFCASCARTRKPIFAANMEISCVRPNQQPCRKRQMLRHEMDLKVG
jgi:hypothetical protein